MEEPEITSGALLSLPRTDAPAGQESHHLVERSVVLHSLLNRPARQTECVA
jgi:hypothetical protein